MGKIIFILGGARSGKSNLSLEMAKKSGKKVGFIATSPYTDENMKDRIQKHKQDRPSDWPTFEESTKLPELINKINHSEDLGFLILDCMTLFVSNLMFDNKPESYIREQTISLLENISSSKLDVAIVSNEVGLGVHPETMEGCVFRDIAGRINQVCAKHADEVYFTVSGIPMKIK